MQDSLDNLIRQAIANRNVIEFTYHDTIELQKLTSMAHTMPGDKSWFIKQGAIANQAACRIGAG